MENGKYCVYIDVLGYSALVEDNTKTQAQIIERLRNIYFNLAINIGDKIRMINLTADNKISINSFSDCFYLESCEIYSLLYFCKDIYNEIFNTYAGNKVGSVYTPLVRGGVVKNWTVSFPDLSGYIDGQNIMNPVGLGVARAYNTSEKKCLSGMRLIISPEIMEEIQPERIIKNGLICYSASFNLNDIYQELFFYRIKKNEKEEKIDLYELIWPDMNSRAYSHIDHLVSIRNQFTLKSFRHYNKTAEIILKSLKVSDCHDINQEEFNIKKQQLEKMASEFFTEKTIGKSIKNFGCLIYKILTARLRSVFGKLCI